MTTNNLVVRVCVMANGRLPDRRGADLVAGAESLGIAGLTGARVADLYFLRGALAPDDVERICRELLADPVTETYSWQALEGDTPVVDETGLVVEVTFLPGVTDPVADQLLRGARVLGVAGLERAATGARYELAGALSHEALALLARRLLCNEVIQCYTLGRAVPQFVDTTAGTAPVECVPVRAAGPDGLDAISRARRLALDRAEMAAIQAYFRGEDRDPTDVELETLAQTWSEHCVHKTFKARIVRPGRPDVDGLLRTFIRAATEHARKPWVRSAFVDNAGIIDFDDEYEVSFKVETHNHPSALEPFGGANTGVGGVVRDVLGVSHRPIATTDVLCFGPRDLPWEALPDGVLHPRRVASGVVAGVQDYGNKLGLPTVNGAILYEAGYTANPLVFCGCIGIAPKGRHVRQAGPGDRVVAIGGRTGRDGLRGATFSSATLTHETGAIASTAVQIGDPITEKGVLEVVVRARDAGLYTAITDCGAGGFSSAVGEMGAEIGADVDLERAPLKYPGLAPWEIWLSEAQERMVLAVPPENLAALRALCAEFDVALSDIGMFTGTGRLVVRYGARVVADLSMSFLHDGIPRRVLELPVEAEPAGVALPDVPGEDYGATLLRLLGHPNIATKEAVIRLYDHEVQGATVVKPLTGVANDGPSDGAVLRPLVGRSPAGLAVACGINPAYAAVDAYAMAVACVDEAMRNVVALGADPERVALLDNFCWGNPRLPDRLATLVRAAEGCYDAAVAYDVPFVSGKDSLNNEYAGLDGAMHSIPPTLLISAMGIVPDVEQAVTMDFKAPGNYIYVLGVTCDELGGSHYALVHGLQGGQAPRHADAGPMTMRALHSAMANGLVRACHDCSEGGLAVALAEMALAGRLGAGVDLASAPGASGAGGARVLLFAESNARFVVEVAPADAVVFEATLAGVPAAHVGMVAQDAGLVLWAGAITLLAVEIEQLRRAWQGA
jgi:phosphoribosylformylglycinamidine synthase II